MKAELKLCQCGDKHAWQIQRYSEDNVPLYGASPTDKCKNFREESEESRELAMMTPKEVGELWSRTNFLNPQVPVATRRAVSAIIDAGKGGKGMLSRVFGGGDKSVMERQWPEFMGLMISQISDMRGTMVRDESKFAHLVAHTDEIVESMRAVQGLKEQLATLNRKMDVLLDPHKDDDVEAIDHFGLTEYLEPPSEIDAMPVPEALNAVRPFTEVSRPTQNEAIDVTDVGKD